MSVDPVTLDQPTVAPPKRRAHPVNITKKQIQKLVQNMYNGLRRHDRPLDPKKDAGSIWFSKECIDKLFALNPEASGLRIYFGMHDGETVPVSRPEYIGQLMTVLVATKDNSANGGTDADDILHHEVVADAAPSTKKLAMPIVGAAEPAEDLSGTGADNGKLCPPDSGCGCI